MLARVVETIYWMARYVERAENMARLINVNNNLLLDLPKGVSLGWEPLIDIVGERDAYCAVHSNFNERTVMKFLLERNESSQVSLNYCLWAARENARTVRDILPREAWERLNSLYHFGKENVAEGVNKKRRFAYLEEVIFRIQSFYGLIEGSLNHDESYLFFRMGCDLERAEMTSRIVDVRSANLVNEEESEPFQNIQWMSVLKSMDAYQMYRQNMNVKVKRAQVLSFLMQSETFPRSILFCINDIGERLADLPRNDMPLRQLMKVKRRVAEQEVQNLRQQALHDVIDDIQLELSKVHNAVNEHYFLSGMIAAQQSQSQS
ncbi:alpha-E domain-containing protein [Planctobacterium marinum]|uniref:alpha-E domain-containing protein n=1 Tax=Planctobacterium marinum TaxID=1631968 RepID=UPI001E3B4E9D|nr:alpha-E domain-containing protein [Planctobacterium marinum]MCC2607489.1 alpha-E domain-containing protein [Planctobacterium marinum]